VRALRESRKPAIHRLLVSEITFAKPRFESGLLHENDIQVKEDKHCESKKQNRKRPLIKTQSHQHYCASYVHWIANESVWPSGDKFTRWIEDRRCPSSPHNKDPCAREDNQCADCSDEDSGNCDPRWQWNLQTFVQPLNARREPSEKHNERRHVAQCPKRNENSCHFK
jgi:hypothetical protein